MGVAEILATILDPVVLLAKNETIFPEPDELKPMEG